MEIIVAYIAEHFRAIHCPLPSRPIIVSNESRPIDTITPEKVKQSLDVHQLDLQRSDANLANVEISIMADTPSLPSHPSIRNANEIKIGGESDSSATPEIEVLAQAHVTPRSASRLRNSLRMTPLYPTDRHNAHSGQRYRSDFISTRGSDKGHTKSADYVEKTITTSALMGAVKTTQPRIPGSLKQRSSGSTSQRVNTRLSLSSSGSSGQVARKTVRPVRPLGQSLNAHNGVPPAHHATSAANAPSDLIGPRKSTKSGTTKIQRQSDVVLRSNLVGSGSLSGKAKRTNLIAGTASYSSGAGLTAPLSMKNEITKQGIQRRGHSSDR